MKTVEESCSAIHKASFCTFKAKIGRFYEIMILVNFEAKLSEFRFLKALWGLILKWKIDQFWLQTCQKKRHEWGYDVHVLRNSGSLNISLLQCYVVLWIHNIDAICSRMRARTIIYRPFYDICYHPRLKNARKMKFVSCTELLNSKSLIKNVYQLCKPKSNCFDRETNLIFLAFSILNVVHMLSMNAFIIE